MSKLSFKHVTTGSEKGGKASIFVVKISGRILREQEKDFESGLKLALEQQHEYTILDFTEVASFEPAVFVHCLAYAYSYASRQGSKVLVVCPHKNMIDALIIEGLNSRLGCFGNLQMAMESIHA